MFTASKRSCLNEDPPQRNGPCLKANILAKVEE